MLYRVSLHNSNGQTLMGVVVSSLIMTILGLAVAALTVNWQHSQKMHEQKMEIIDLQVFLAQFVDDRKICPCQLDKDVSGKTGVVLNTSVDPIPDIDLLSLSNSCTPGTDVVVINDAVMPSSRTGLTVDRVQIKKIIPTTGDRYTGELTVSFKSNPARRDIQVPLLFSIDPSTGTPTTRRIIDCGVPLPRRLVSCPSNAWELIGPPNAAGSFCIEKNPRPPPPVYSVARFECGQLNVTMPQPIGHFGLCQIERLGVACKYGKNINGLPGPGELIEDIFTKDTDIALTRFGFGRCDVSGLILGLGPYRCCLHE